MSNQNTKPEVKLSIEAQARINRLAKGVRSRLHEIALTTAGATVILVFTLAACSKRQPPTGTATLTGTLAGEEIKIQDAYAEFAQRDGAAIVNVRMGTVSGMCASAREPQSEREPTTELLLGVTVTNGGVVPRSYTVTGSALNSLVGANVFTEGKGGDVSGNAEAQSGTISLTSITSSQVVGTYDLVFPDGHLQGSFSAGVCQAVSSPLPSASVAASSSVVRPAPVVTEATLDGGLETHADQKVSVVLEGHDASLPYGYAVLEEDGSLDVRLSSVALPCASYPQNAYGLHFAVPSGPGGKHFAGKPIGIALDYTMASAEGKDPFAMTAEVSQVTIEPFTATLGQSVRGAIHVDAASSQIQTRMAHGDTNSYAYKGDGTFDVTLCRVDTSTVTPTALPEQPVASPAAGTVAGQPFVARSAVAFLWHRRETNLDAIDSIELFADAGVTCATRTREAKSVNIEPVAGANSRTGWLGSPQPASFKQDFVTRGGGGVSWSESGLGHGYIVLDHVDLRGGGHVTGSAVLGASGAPDLVNQGAVSGRFDAVVCAMGAL